MRCEVCGIECGIYKLCYACNQKRANLGIYKCTYCGNWHVAGEKCPEYVENQNEVAFVYSLKDCLLTRNEQNYYKAIRSVLPPNFCVFPQINLATIIEKNSKYKFRSELFRNLDFLVTDAEYHPKIAIEINDATHLNIERRERDKKVKSICEEAGITLLSLWSSQGVNIDYMQKRIFDILQSPPPVRVANCLSSGELSEQTYKDDSLRSVSYATCSANQYRISRLKMPHLRIKLPKLRIWRRRKRYRRHRRHHKGCYIATCVYGSYDCAAVWTLRRFRDAKLEKRVLGRMFILVYYTVSPMLVKLFGSHRWFCMHWRKRLDQFVAYLNRKGISNMPYED